MKKEIDKIKSFDRFLNETITSESISTKNLEIDEIFTVHEIISYNYEFTAQVIKVHDGGRLLDVILFHPKAGVVSTPTSIASSLCVKFRQI